MNQDFVILVIQFFVSMTSIIGAFFYIRMGNWLQSVYKLESKWKVSQHEPTPNNEHVKHLREQALFELQFEVREYKNNIFKNLLFFIDLFLLGLVLLSIYLYLSVPGLIDVFWFFLLPFWTFFVVFFLSSLYVIGKGEYIISEISKSLNLGADEDFKDTTLTKIFRILEGRNR
ncbi:MAG: hypothetical protein ACFFFG_14120 [Candidatus Thorarchaeota archaeon]